MRAAAILASLALTAAAPVAAQSNIRNAEVLVRPAGDLRETVSALSAGPGPFWIGYQVPAHDPEWNACCFHTHALRPCGRCDLETRNRPSGSHADEAGVRPPVRLEPAPLALVLLRVQDGRVSDVRAYSAACEIDAGGRRIYWLDGADAAQSSLLLASLAEESGDGRTNRRRAADGALMALAAHREPAALDALLRLARTGADVRTRGQALFWLAQRAGQKAVAAITDAIEHDPETDVKTRAVFALSQLPAEEGVPRLIEVARSHRNPKVRRQAFFWLGQSTDPRALRFLEEVLFATPPSPRR